MGLHHGPLVALAFKDALLALVLLNLRYHLVMGLSSAVAAGALVLLVASSIALGRPRPLHFGPPFRRIVALLHDVRLRDVMCFILLIVNLIVLLEVLREGFLVLVGALAVHEETVVLRVDELRFGDGAGALLRVESRGASCRCGAAGAAPTPSDQPLLQAILLDALNVVLDVRPLEARARGVEKFAPGHLVVWRSLRLVFDIEMVLGALVARVCAPAPVTLRWHLLNRIVEVGVSEHGCLARVNLLLVLVVILGRARPCCLIRV